MFLLLKYVLIGFYAGLTLPRNDPRKWFLRLYNIQAWQQGRHNVHESEPLIDHQAKGYPSDPGKNPYTNPLTMFVWS